MKKTLFLATVLAANTIASRLSAEEVPVSLEQMPEGTDVDEPSADQTMESVITRRLVVHRNLALGTYIGFVMSDISGIVSAVLLHTDRTGSTAYDVLRYGHWGVGFLSVAAYIPQSIIAWRTMLMKKKLGLPINRRHMITSLLTTIGVVVEVAGIAALAAMGGGDSPHFKTVTAVHCAASTFLVVVPFTVAAINSRPRSRR